jgi:hypothetical protein
MKFDDIYTLNRPCLLLKIVDKESGSDNYLLVEFINLYAENFNQYIIINADNTDSIIEIDKINSNKEIVDNLVNSLEDNKTYKLSDNKNNLLDT